jgi:hypothetical protein
VPSRFTRIEAPLSSLVAIAYVLRRTPNAEATTRLLELVSDPDPSIAEQASLSIVEHGAAACDALAARLPTLRLGGTTWRALMTSPTAERSVVTWLPLVPARFRGAVFPAVPRTASRLRLAMADACLGHADEMLAKDAVRACIGARTAAIPLLRGHLHGESSRSVHRALAAAAWLGVDARPLLDDVLPLLDGRGHRTAMWAAQAIAAMAPAGDDSQRVATLARELLAKPLPSARRAALLCMLGAVRPVASASIDVLVDAVRRRVGPERSIALAVLIEVGALDRLGDDAVAVLRGEVADAVSWSSTPQRRTILRAAIERLPTSELRTVLPSSDSPFALDALPVPNAATSAAALERASEWIDDASPALRRIAIAAHVERIRRGTGVPTSEFLAAEAVAPERFGERLHALLAVQDLPEPWMTKVAEVVASRSDGAVWDRLLHGHARRRVAIAVVDAAIRGPDDDAGATAARDAVRRAGRNRFDEATLLGWLGDADARIVELAIEPATILRPLPAAVRGRWLSGLRSSDVEVRRRALGSMTSAARFDGGLLDDELRDAVAACFAVSELRDDALTVLLNASAN